MTDPWDLNAQIAQRLFGWRYLKAERLWEDPQQYLWVDDDIPAYTTDPDATALVWQWVERHVPGVLEISYEYFAGNGRVVCTLYYPSSAGMIGDGVTWQEALCRAALALADALAGEA